MPKNQENFEKLSFFPFFQLSDSFFCSDNWWERNLYNLWLSAAFEHFLVLRRNCSNKIKVLANQRSDKLNQFYSFLSKLAFPELLAKFLVRLLVAPLNFGFSPDRSST